MHFFPEIKEHVDSLEEWLEEMENTLQPLPLNSRWSKKAISEKMKELKVSSHLFVTMQIIYAVGVFCELCIFWYNNIMCNNKNLKYNRKNVLKCNVALKLNVMHLKDRCVTLIYCTLHCGIHILTDIKLSEYCVIIQLLPVVL